MRDKGNPAPHPGRLEHRLANLLDGKRRIVAAVVQLDLVGLFIFGHGKHHASKVLHIDTRLDGVLAAGIGKLVALEAPVKAGHVAVLAGTEYDSRTHDGEPSIGAFSSPFTVNFLSNQLGNAVRSVRGRKSIFGLQVFGSPVRCNAAGKNNVVDAVLAGKIADVFRTADVRLEVRVVGVARRAVNRREIENQGILAEFAIH